MDATGFFMYSKNISFIHPFSLLPILQVRGIDLAISWGYGLYGEIIIGEVICPVAEKIYTTVRLVFVSCSICWFILLVPLIAKGLVFL